MAMCAMRGCPAGGQGGAVMRAQSEARSPRRRGERAGRPGCRQHATANGRMLSPRVAIHPIGPIILRTAHARAQDVEFCVRARKHDVPLTFCAGAVVAHAFNPGLRGLFRQFLRYGLFERQMCARHPEYLSWLSITTEISSFDVRLAEAGAAAGVRANGGASGPPGPDAAPVAGHAAG